MEQFMNKMYELYLDMLQDTNASARTEERYHIFIQGIVNNLRLNYSKNDLMISSDESFINMFKTLEPDVYQRKFQELIKTDKDIDEYECGK